MIKSVFPGQNDHDGKNTFGPDGRRTGGNACRSSGTAIRRFLSKENDHA